MIVRGPHPRHSFTVLANATLRHRALSFRARGLLAFLLSQPEGYSTSAHRLAKEGAEGRGAILTSLGELEKAGYLVRRTLRDELGRFVPHSVVYDSPQPVDPVLTVAVQSLVTNDNQGREKTAAMENNGRPLPEVSDPPGTSPRHGLLTGVQKSDFGEPDAGNLDANTEELVLRREELQNLETKSKDQDLETTNNAHAPARALALAGVRALACSRVREEPTPESIVFAAWQTSTARPRAVLDEKRKTLVRKRLQEGYSVEDLCAAVDGWRHSPHHRGENVSGTIYNDLGLLLRDAEHVDRFIGLALSPRRRSPTSTRLTNQERGLAMLQELHDREQEERGGPVGHPETPRLHAGDLAQLLPASGRGEGLPDR